METRKVYHYTNSKAYESMKTPGKNGFSVEGYDDFTGLIPVGTRLLPYHFGDSLPEKARDSGTYFFLEKDLGIWLDEGKFPYTGRHLMNNLYRGEDSMLLSFVLDEIDDAWVFDRSIMERELQTPQRADELLEKQMMNKAGLDFWNSRVPIFEYLGNYELPLGVLWSGIEFDRLEIEWYRPKMVRPKTDIDIDDFFGRG